MVVNLAGVADRRQPALTEVGSARCATSRVATTRVLAEAIARADGRPAFLAGNGIAYYGDHGDEVVTEASRQPRRRLHDPGDPGVAGGRRPGRRRPAPGCACCGPRRCWTGAAPPLKQLRPLFKLGLGARLGDGRQYFPMISLRDWVGAVAILAEHPTARGPFNLCCPETPTNAEFTAGARPARVHRPAFLAVAGAACSRLGAGRLRPSCSARSNAPARGPARRAATGSRTRTSTPCSPSALALTGHRRHPPPLARADQHHPAAGPPVARQRVHAVAPGRHGRPASRSVTSSTIRSVVGAPHVDAEPPASAARSPAARARRTPRSIAPVGPPGRASPACRAARAPRTSPSRHAAARARSHARSTRDRAGPVGRGRRRPLRPAGGQQRRAPRAAATATSTPTARGRSVGTDAAHASNLGRSGRRASASSTGVGIAGPVP